jgi:hypothetical protein
MMFWAVLQLGAPTLAASADAVVSAASVGAHAHLESRTSSSCVRVHDTECVFCQFLSMGASPAASPIPELPPVAQVALAAPELSTPHRAPLRGAAIPRAPPLV